MKYTVSSIKRRLGALLVLYIHKEWRLKEFSQIRVSVYCGVPQGSLLGPLLFNVFIKDLIFSIQLSSLRLCADETTAYASNTNISALKLSLNQDLENLSSWFASNYFSVRQWQEKPSIDPSKQSHEPALAKVPKRRVGASWEAGNVYNTPRTALPGDHRTSEHCPYCRFHHGAM